MRNLEIMESKTAMERRSFLLRINSAKQQS